MSIYLRSSAAMCTLALAAAALGQTGTAIKLTPLSSGAMPKMGGYLPVRLDLADEKPATITKLPDGVGEGALYGIIKLGAADGPAKYHVVVIEPDGKPAVLLVDANGNGDLTDDPETEWKPNPYKSKEQDLTRWAGGATIQLKSGDETFPAHLGMYRFDKADPERGQLKDKLIYFCDYAWEGEVTVGGKAYKALLTDSRATGDFRGVPAPEGKTDADWDSGVHLKLDVNGNGTFDARGEDFDVREPFNIKGTTYEITAMSPIGSSFQVVKSSREVAEIPTPPDHSVGKKVTAFEATLVDGKAVKFPGDYKGRVVMLDFWATWCGPCMGEVPGLVAAYEKFHGQGFDVLGISLDRENALEKLTSVTADKKMTWPQVYDGKFWKAAIADMYVIRSIPAAFLVDGDTGEILASGGSLRGEKLEETIAAALSKKKAN